MSDDEDEIELKPLDAVSAYPLAVKAAEGINRLFSAGFTIPESLRLNSIYGKYASDVNSPRDTRYALIAIHGYFLAKRARAVLRLT